MKADQAIDFDLNFIRPFVSKNKTAFKLEPKGAGTDVTWTMVGPKNFMLKAMMLFMDIEGLVAKDFDKGLAELKTTAEATAVPAAPAPAPAAAPAKES